MKQRTIKATLTLTCDVSFNDLIKKKAEEECNVNLSDEETAKKILFAFLNPKIDFLNDEDEMISGSWDMVCEFNGTLNNFVLNID